MRQLAPVPGLVLISYLLLSLLVGCGAPTASIPVPAVSPTAVPVTAVSTNTPLPTATPVQATQHPRPLHPRHPTLDSRPIHTGLLNEIFPDLGQLARITNSLHLNTGLGDMGLSSNLDYHLKLDATGLNGPALFEADYYVGKFLTFQDARQINVPLDKANEFFEKLARHPWKKARTQKPGGTKLIIIHPYLSSLKRTGAN